MDDVAEAVEGSGLELLFGFGDRTSDAKAEAGVLVDGDYCCNVVMIIVVLL